MVILSVLFILQFDVDVMPQISCTNAIDKQTQNDIYNVVAGVRAILMW